MASRRGFIEGLSGSQATVLFDWRGSGLSAPLRGPITLEDLADDIAAVCEAVGEPLDVMLMNSGCFPGLLHATTCGTWRRILLVAPSRTPQEGFGAAGMRILDEESERNYRLLWGHILRSAMDVSLAEVEPLVRQAVSQVPLASWIAYQQALRGADLSTLAPQIDSEVFVAVPEQDSVRVPAMNVAGLFPAAQLLVQGVAHHTPSAGAELRKLMDGAAPADVVPSELSRRESQVLRLLAHGRTNAQVAAELVITEATVARHVHNILVKLDCANRAEAAAWAAKNGLA
jgi:DNA-binding CsgD family transcriptional regulator/pimeloyl-ACP methyl ester carboxylesterase